MRRTMVSVLVLCGLLAGAWADQTSGSTLEPAEAAVLKTVTVFTDGMVRHDAAAISSAWHPNGRLFVLEDMNTIDLLTGIPSFVQIVFDECRPLCVDERIAVVRLTWRMIMPKTIGYHTSYLNLIEEDGRWLIISETDHGIEKAR